MRIDKFLKISRIIKRRTLAKEVADQGRVMVNGKVVKSSYTVKEGDYIKIVFGQKQLTVKVNQLTESPKKEDLLKLYEIVEESPNENRIN